MTGRAAVAIRRSLLFLVDVAVILAFVVIGRDTHDEAPGFTGVAQTAGPFLIALAAGWVAARAWRRPERVTTGVIVATVTIVLGLVLRRSLFGEGTALAFVLVAAAFLGLALVGWRGLAARFSSRPSPDRPAGPPSNR